MELEDEQAFLHTVLEHKIDDVVQTKRQNLPSSVSVLDYTNDMFYDSDESSSCDESDNDETIASFWRKNREAKKVSESENEMEVDVLAVDSSSPELTPEMTTLENDDEQRDCTVFPWNIEHDLIPTGKVKRARQTKEEKLVGKYKDGPSKKREASEEATSVKKKSFIGSKFLDSHCMDNKRHCAQKKRRKMNKTDFNDGISRKSDAMEEPTVVEKNFMKDIIVHSALDEDSFQKGEQVNEQIETGYNVKDGNDEQMKVDQPPQTSVKHEIGHKEDEENLKIKDDINLKESKLSPPSSCEKKSMEAKHGINGEKKAEGKKFEWYGSRPKHASAQVNMQLKKIGCGFCPGASHAICLVVWVIGRKLALRYGYFTKRQLQLAVDAVIESKISSGTISKTKYRQCIQIIKNSCFHKVDASKPNENIQNETESFREAFAKNVIDDTHLLKTLSSPWDDLDITKADDFINRNNYNGDLKIVARSFEDVLRYHIDYIREVARNANLLLTSHEWRYFFLSKDEDSFDTDFTIESSRQGPSNGENMNAGLNKPLTKCQPENEHMQVQEDDMNVEIQFEGNNLKSDHISQERLFPVITFRSDVSISKKGKAKKKKKREIDLLSAEVSFKLHILKKFKNGKCNKIEEIKAVKRVARLVRGRYHDQIHDNLHEGHTKLPQFFIDEVNKLGFEWDVSSTTVFGRDLDSITHKNIRDMNMKMITLI